MIVPVVGHYGEPGWVTQLLQIPVKGYTPKEEWIMSNKLFIKLGLDGFYWSRFDFDGIFIII